MRSGALETLTTRFASPLRPKSSSGPHQMIRHKRQPSRFDQENAPPPDPNIPLELPIAKNPDVAKPHPPEANTEPDAVGKPEPAPAQPNSSAAKVLVRIRPPNAIEEGLNRIVQKISPNSLTVEDKSFAFDSVIGPGSTQEDAFQLVGSSVVKDSLAGFNTSILCYGETGSGKSYTMWGPLSSMLEEHSASSSQGLASRIFLMLFSEIQKMKQNAENKPTNFQCRCSFLEIYNEQISDLLDPTQRNLEIKDDPRNGFYVENLSEEYVNNMEDVTQVLVKGLSNRRVGATSINSKSSRSHVVLTCIIESWSKGATTESINSSKTSRINLVDLAGLESTIPDGASGRYKKEGRQIKKSLSKLGKLINELAEVQHSAKTQTISYSDSSLTHLLRETLGGNAKATFICAVSPVQKCKAGTLSTLRFAQQAKHFENKAVINEISEDYVNDLSDQIRQLKEELIREKTCDGKFSGATNGFFRRHNVRGSLNVLKASLNRSLILPHIESDAEEEFVDADDGDVNELCEQLSSIQSSLIGSPGIDCQSKDLSKDSNTMIPEISRVSFSDEEVYTDLSDCVKTCSESKESSFNIPVPQDIKQQPSPAKLSVSPRQSLVFHEPTLCTSPKINSPLMKSFSGQAAGVSDCENQNLEGQLSNSGQLLLGRGDHVRSSLQSSKLSPTDCLAASLRRGLQIIECHQQRSASRSSLVGFSFDYMKNPSQLADRTDVSVQTLVDDEFQDSSCEPPFICASCKKMEEHSNKQMTPVDASEDNGKDQNYEAAKRAAELEKVCAEQAALIRDLNLQVEQFKIENVQKSSKDLSHDIQIKEMVIGECNDGPSSDGSQHIASFGIEERSALLEEIKSLRSQLQAYSDSSKNVEADDGLKSSEKVTEDFEKERQGWTESESRWISLTEELRVDLESLRRIAEKKDLELASEKRCSEELDDALRRAILGHAKIVEHYAELQEKYIDLLDEHKQVMDGIAQVRRAAAKASKKGAGSAFARALNSELSKERAQKEKERKFLREQNRVLKIQLRDTAEAVHAAGELLVKLREAEETASVAEERFGRAQQEVERLRKQMEKMKKKHAMEMVAVKQYMAESRLPEAALEPLFKQEHEAEQVDVTGGPMQYDSQSWRAAFEPSYR